MCVFMLVEILVFVALFYVFSWSEGFGFRVIQGLGDSFDSLVHAVRYAGLPYGAEFGEGE